ncbi:MAG: glycerol-3-phosphate dehydrogenase [Granulosicoccus sp.]|nr:glycerol-3-phosphate dehydrogenase [Granulosicoccus sp.]
MNRHSDNDYAGHYDLCVIGGGINGVGIARDAAGRGLSVLLVEKDDLSEATSSRSGKLVHGGLRYLEYYEFRLVREALIEREVLLESAPHIIWPMRFVLPHSAEDRPAWLVRAGLFLYDHLGGRKRLPGTRILNLHREPEGKPLKPQYRKAFEYSDCWAEDSRLVVLNAVDAAEKGAHIRTRTAFVNARRTDEFWSIDIKDRRHGTTETVTARCLVNAAGPWVNQVIDRVQEVSSRRRVRLVKGSHLVMRKFWEGEQAYLIQHSDKRVIFINPYEKDKALIGTTDIPYEGDPSQVTIDEAEIDYLLSALNRYFRTPLTRDDILSTFSGVRPLYDDDSENPSAVTRDYLFDIDKVSERIPLLSVFGGKITTFRKLAEHAIDQLTDTFPEMGKPWTRDARLPGGDMEQANFQLYLEKLQARYAQLEPDLVLHYARLYGTRAEKLLQSVTHMEDLGQRFGQHLFEKEVRYLVDHEWAQTPSDILRRRTKHELHMSDTEIAQFEQWFDSVWGGRHRVKVAS